MVELEERENSDNVDSRSLEGSLNVGAAFRVRRQVSLIGTGESVHGVNFLDDSLVMVTCRLDMAQGSWFLCVVHRVDEDYAAL